MSFLNFKLMREPAIGKTGITYEKEALLKVIGENSNFFSLLISTRSYWLWYCDPRTLQCWWRQTKSWQVLRQIIPHEKELCLSCCLEPFALSKRPFCLTRRGKVVRKFDRSLVRLSDRHKKKRSLFLSHHKDVCWNVSRPKRLWFPCGILLHALRSLFFRQDSERSGRRGSLRLGRISGLYKRDQGNVVKAFGM